MLQVPDKETPAQVRIEETPEAPNLVEESVDDYPDDAELPKKFWRDRHPSAVCPVAGTAANTKDPTAVK